ncbi:MAG TPA: hypothetical protein VIJ51_17185 [Solirubrobacteraceae bacterium]
MRHVRDWPGFNHRGQLVRARRLGLAASLAVAASVAVASGASGDINTTQPEAPAAVEITAGGILWTGDGSDMVSPNGTATPLLPVSGGGIEPADLAIGPRVGPGGCHDWVADPTGATSETGVALAVSDGKLIVAGSPACRRTPPTTPRPLFARSLAAGGTWRVLRWLPNAAQPLLSARGDWLAVGTPRADGTMLAQVVDARTGRLRNQLDIPTGYLAVAESGALVDAVGFVAREPDQPVGDAPYKMLYVPAGARRARSLLGMLTVRGVPAISDGRVAYKLENTDGTQTLAVTNLRTRRTRLVAGFRPGARGLEAFDLRGDLLAWVQSNAPPPPTTPPPPPTGPCTVLPYVPPAPRTLHTTDLSRPAAFVPAPPAPATPPALVCNAQ